MASTRTTLTTDPAAVQPPQRAVAPSAVAKPIAARLPPALAPTPLLHRAGSPVLTHPTSHNAVKIHVTGQASKEALLDAIKASRASFFIETFEWHDDLVGNEMIQALAARKRQAQAEGKPFDAKVLLDWQGMQDRAGDEVVVQKLQAAGVEVQIYNRGIGRGPSPNPLTHRKVYIQDGDKYLTGGRNIGDEYFGKHYVDSDGERKNSWHDLLVTIEGDETSRVLNAFFEDWVQAGGKSPSALPAVHPSPTGTARVQTFVTDPERQIFSIRSAHDAMIKSARQEIDLQVPYMSDNTLIDQLIAAKRARPGLKVRVMLPAVHENTTGGQAFALLNDDAALRLTQAGIEVRMFGGGHENGKALERFSHLKAMVVDGAVMSVGSANGDARTYAQNHELISVVEDPESVGEFLKQVVRPDWNDSKPYNPAAALAWQSPIAALSTTFWKGLSGLL